MLRGGWRQHVEMAARHTQGVGAQHISRAQQTKNWCVVLFFPPHPPNFIPFRRSKLPLFSKLLIKTMGRGLRGPRSDFQGPPRASEALAHPWPLSKSPKDLDLRSPQVLGLGKFPSHLQGRPSQRPPGGPAEPPSTRLLGFGTME